MPASDLQKQVYTDNLRTKGQRVCMQSDAINALDVEKYLGTTNYSVLQRMQNGISGKELAENYSACCYARQISAA